MTKVDAESSMVKNVIVTSHKEPMRKLRGLVRLEAAGFEVHLAQFAIDVVLVDCKQVPWEVLGFLAKPVPGLSVREQLYGLLAQWYADVELARIVKVLGILSGRYTSNECLVLVSDPMADDYQWTMLVKNGEVEVDSQPASDFFKNGGKLLARSF